MGTAISADVMQKTMIETYTGIALEDEVNQRGHTPQPTAFNHESLRIKRVADDHDIPLKIPAGVYS